MYQVVKRHISCIGLSALLITSLGLPAQAQYTKLFQFTNLTGVSQTSVRAVTNGLESIVSQYSDPSGWTPARLGSVLVSGVYCTTITLGGSSLGALANISIGWQTADNSCRLRDLRWGTGQTVVPAQLGGVPGGAIMFYDWPNPGELTVVITNDNPEDGQWLDLTKMEFGVSPAALDPGDLSDLSGGGDLTEVRVAKIDHDISVLRAEVVFQRASGGITRPSGNDLIAMLDVAACLKDKGWCAYNSGNQKLAKTLWKTAAQHMANFICHVTNLRRQRRLSQDLYDRWIVDGDGQITTAPEIHDALLALPEGKPIENLPPPPAAIPLPPYAGLDPEGYRPWPVDILYPGEYTAFVVAKIDPGAGFIIRGSVEDDTGTSYLNWIEQGVAEPTVPDLEPPFNASIAINGGAPYTNSTAVTLSLHAQDNVGVILYELTDASGTRLGTINPAVPNYSVQVPGALSPGDGAKMVSVRYSDAAGNWSDLIVGGITLDQTPPIVTIVLPGTGRYHWNQPGLTATWSAADVVSGVVPPSSGTIPIDTSVLGTGLRVVVPAGAVVDGAGNPSLETAADYTVLWEW